MPAHDVDVARVVTGAALIALVVAVSVGAVFALLAFWHEPAGGAPSGAAALTASLRATGRALQSAPQAERAAMAASDAAARAPAGGRR